MTLFQEENTPNTNPTPPPVALLQLITGKWISHAISTVAHLGIADLLKDGTKSCQEIAQNTQTDQKAIYRLLRALASVGIFSEVAPQQFSQTAMSSFLLSDIPGSLNGMAKFFGLKAYNQGWLELLHSVKTGEPAFVKANGKPLFQHLMEVPADAAVFNEAMSGFAAQGAIAIATAYDFSAFNIIADIGGGHGLLLATILHSYPLLRGMLFDLPKVVEGANSNLVAVQDRCELIGGDFFQGVPEGADAYILKNVIHDWSDEQALLVLKAVAKSMRSKTKLLLVESVIPSGNAPFFGKLLDLEMLVTSHGGCERNETEFRSLVEASGFRFIQIIPTASPLSIIEAEKL
jgi:hypothetical protein